MWRVTVAQDKVMIEIKHQGLVERLLNEKAPSSPREKQHRSIVIEVSVRLQRRGVEGQAHCFGSKATRFRPRSQPRKSSCARPGMVRQDPPRRGKWSR